MRNHSGQGIGRRRLLVGMAQAAGLLFLTGCDNLSRSEWFTRLLDKTEIVTQRAQRLISPKKAMAKEFIEADLSPVFPPNGNRDPENPDYQRMANNGFADWKLEVGGVVQQPMTFSLVELRDLPSRRRSHATIAWRDGARSANGRARHSVRFWNASNRCHQRGTSSSIAPTPTRTAPFITRVWISTMPSIPKPSWPMR